MIFLIKIVLRFVVLLAVLIAAYIFVPAIGSISVKALHHSVSSEVGGSLTGGARACRAPHGATRRCDVRTGGGTVRYTVKLDGRCWTAHRSGSARGLPAQAHGCVKLRDQLRILDRVVR